MTENEQFKTLRSHGYRITPQRVVILNYLQGKEGHASPTEIFEHINSSIDGVTEATVYRTLDFLEKNDLIHASLNINGHLVYEIAGRHHHHIICRSCGASVEIDHSLLEDLYLELEEVSGYELTGNHLTFFGLCPECRPRKSL